MRNKIRLSIIIVFMIIGNYVFSQTLFVPSDTNGISDVINGTSNVGVGTNSPSTKLNVNGNQLNNRISQSGGTYTEFAQRTWSGSAGILFSAYASDTYVIGGLYATGNTKYKFNASVFGASNHGAKMIYTDHSSIKFYISPASTGAGTDVNWGPSILSLNRGGNIGIGTASPSVPLEISVPSSTYESAFKVTLADAPSDYFILINGTGTSGQFIPILKGYHVSDNRTGCSVMSEINSDMDYGSNALMSFNARISDGVVSTRPLFQWSNYNQRKMILLANGNLGIGISSPTEKLVVDGKIKAEEIIVADVDGADFVFESDYQLPSLQETENFIKANKHLPGVPSAKQMQEDGLTIGEMNIMLLQKIEELTLYVIDQENRMSKLEKENQDQAKEIHELKSKLNTK